MTVAAVLRGSIRQKAFHNGAASEAFRHIVEHRRGGLRLLGLLATRDHLFGLRFRLRDLPSCLSLLGRLLLVGVRLLELLRVRLQVARSQMVANPTTTLWTALLLLALLPVALSMGNEVGARWAEPSLAGIRPELC